jgi:hypothetical protein
MGIAPLLAWHSTIDKKSGDCSVAAAEVTLSSALAS